MEGGKQRREKEREMVGQDMPRKENTIEGKAKEM